MLLSFSVFVCLFGFGFVILFSCWSVQPSFRAITQHADGKLWSWQWMLLACHCVTQFVYYALCNIPKCFGFEQAAHMAQVSHQQQKEKSTQQQQQLHSQQQYNKNDNNTSMNEHSTTSINYKRTESKATGWWVRVEQQSGLKKRQSERGRSISKQSDPEKKKQSDPPNNKVTISV